MKSLAIFLLRGALGAIIGTIILTLAFSVFAGGYYLIWMVMFIRMVIAIQGAFGMTVGLVCWAAAGSSRRIGTISRAAIGTGTVFGVYISFHAYQLIKEPYAIDFLSLNVLFYGLYLLIGSFAVGGLAALTCPAEREINFTSPLSILTPSGPLRNG
jgi:hypothetical protein